MMTQSSSQQGPSLIPSSLRIPRCGNWLPEDTWILRTWLSNLVDHVDTYPRPLHPVIREFQSMIEDDATLYMLFHEMFEQAPQQDAYSRDPFGNSQVRDYKHLLRLLNEVVMRAPLFSDSELIGLPMNAILDWLMSTPAGISAFGMPSLNTMIQKVLEAWTVYLSSPASCGVLNESQLGWLGPPALAAMRASTSIRRTSRWTFESTFICNPSLPHFGFQSWDDFFTRRFRPGIRPIASPGDDSVITNPCEAVPYRIYRRVRRLDKFWIKAQPYSLEHMLAHDPFTPNFVGGTIYQAFLDAMNYHRWHAPCTGIIRKAYVVPGTYFSQNLVHGFPNSEVRTRTHSKAPSVASSMTWRRQVPDMTAQGASLSYAAAVATRAVIIIEADHPGIGLICVLPVGMAEVSTCDLGVEEGQRVRKGDELGTFRFGGSTVCLILREGVDVVWDMHGQEADLGLDSKCIPVNARIARIARKREKRKESLERIAKGKAKEKGKDTVILARGWRGEAMRM